MIAFTVSWDTNCSPTSTRLVSAYMLLVFVGSAGRPCSIVAMSLMLKQSGYCEKSRPSDGPVAQLVGGFVMGGAIWRLDMVKHGRVIFHGLAYTVNPVEA